MSEYAEFRQWASDKARELLSHADAERAFLRDLYLLNQELMEVTEGLRDIGRASIFTIWGRLKRWARLFPEPLGEARLQMRRIRERHGEAGQIRVPPPE
jgi:hypothetical protein